MNVARQDGNGVSVNCRQDCARAHDGVEPEELTNREITEPFNPSDIRISKRVVSIDQIIRRIKTHAIQLAPDFQRNLVWDKTKKSRLIESLMLNIPIPLFYVAESKDGNWEVVDGLQRLSAIKEFLIDKSFRLQDLEVRDEYNGKTIEEISAYDFNRIYETEFSMVIVEAGTPDPVKYNIFQRINTGGMYLSNQEIRHALYQGAGTRLLGELVKSKEFRTVTGESISDSRMTAREVILRCLVFMALGSQGYRSNDNLDAFLRRGLQFINDLDIAQANTKNPITIEELRERFKSGMSRSEQIFGNLAFRVMRDDGKRSAINRSLLEVWGVLLSALTQVEFANLLSRRQLLLEKFRSLSTEVEFSNAISRRSGQKKNVDYRFSAVDRLIKEVLDA